MISVYANDPDLLKGEPIDLVGAIQLATARAVHPFRERISRNHTNWAVVAAPCEGWADKVFPDVPAGQRVSRLWEAIGRALPSRPSRSTGRLGGASAGAHDTTGLPERQALMTTLSYSGPGTDLTIGLPPGHLWISGRTTSMNGIPFTANLPTEEVFTMPHKDRVDGGRPIVEASQLWQHADRGTSRFASLEGASSALDRRSAGRQCSSSSWKPTPARRGSARWPSCRTVRRCPSRGFSSTNHALFDENAASHIALGNAYKFTLSGGDGMSDEEFEHAGGNRSATHVDFMIGSGEIDIDGVLKDGRIEPLMRRGEWASRRSRESYRRIAKLSGALCQPSPT